MMQLIILTKKWGRNFSGATLATQYLAKCWESYMDSMIVLTLECGVYDRSGKIRVIRCKNIRKMRWMLRRIRDIALEERYLFGYSDDHLGGMFYDAGIPYVHTYHGSWPDARYTNMELFCKSFYFMPLYKKAIRHAQAVAAVSEYMRRYTCRLNANSVVIRNGMDDKKEEHGTIQEKTFVMVGSIGGIKYKYAIRLAKDLADIAPDIKIHIYGRTDNERIAAALKKLPNVKWMGEQANIPYKAYCGLINTSKIENLPISACEAIRDGIPVLAFGVGGIPEVVINGRTGYIVKAYDCRALAKTIYSYASKQVPMQVDVSVLEKFDWNYAALKYWKLFQKCKGERIPS